MAERRATTRQRTFLNGRLTFHNGNSSEDCLVRDMTEAGARIELPHPRAPEAFELAIPSRGFRASARVAWRNGTRLGLALAPAGAAPDVAEKPAADDQRY
jgi:hypothetical protein